MTYTLVISAVGCSQPRDVIVKKTGFRSVESAVNYFERSEHTDCAYQVIDELGGVVASN